MHKPEFPPLCFRRFETAVFYLEVVRSVRHLSQYMVHTSDEECQGKNTSLSYQIINCAVVRDGAITHHSTLCSKMQAGYQVDELGIPRRARILQSTTQLSESNALPRSTEAATSPIRKSRRRSMRTRSDRMRSTVDFLGVKPD